MAAPRRNERAPVVVAYAAFVLIGVSAGVTTVLLPAQIGDYGVGKAAIGTTFFTFSAGFVLASFMIGHLIEWLGLRLSMACGAALFVAAATYLATRPPFVAFVVVQVVAGYGVGLLESGLNAYITALPNSTPRMNRLHAFWGTGALIGPVLAAALTHSHRWTIVWWVLAVAAVPLVFAVLFAYPVHPARAARAVPPAGGVEAAPRAGLLATVLHDRGVLLAATLLAVYVGLEIGVGNWGYSYLVDARGYSTWVAGYALSGFWLGLTLGRFAISPMSARVRTTPGGLLLVSLVGVTVTSALTWVAPDAAAAAGFVVLGFFLAPIFPTTMALVPSVTTERLVPAAVGVLNAGSVIGGSALPWLAGATAQGIGTWTLLPFAALLGAVQLVVCALLVRRLRAGRGGPGAQRVDRAAVAGGAAHAT